MLRFFGGGAAGISSASCNRWRTVSGLAGRKRHRRNNCEMRLTPKVGFSCFSSMILSVMGPGRRSGRGPGTPGCKPASPPSRYAWSHSPRLLLLTFSSSLTKARLNPSSICSFTAFSFSATVKRREFFAPPAPLGGALPLLLCDYFFIHVNTPFIIGVSTPSLLKSVS